MTKTLLLLPFFLDACAGHPAQKIRRPSETPLAALGEIVRKDPSSAAYGPSTKAGADCRMTWNDALAYCGSRGEHLPTARGCEGLARGRSGGGPLA